MSKGAQAIGGGDLDKKINLGGGGEIGQLADSFNKMTEDLRKSRNELILSKDYTDNIITSMLDTLIAISPDGHIETLNKAACTILGYEEKELIGQPFGKVISEEVFRGTKLPELVEKGSIVNMEATYRAKDGRQIPMTLTGSAMRDKEGKLTGIVAAARDMREMQRLIHEEKVAREYSNGILSSMNEGLVVLDIKDKIVEVNNSFLDLIGYSRAEVMGNSPEMYLPEREKKRVAAVIRNSLINNKEVKNFEQIIITKDGKEILVSLNSGFLRDSDSNITATFAVINDITESKHAQDRVQAALLEAREKTERLKRTHKVFVGREFEMVMHVFVLIPGFAFSKLAHSCKAGFMEKFQGSIYGCNSD